MAVHWIVIRFEIEIGKMCDMISLIDVFYLQHELSTLLYPVFVHMYLLLILYDHNEHAANFLEKFGPEQEDYCQEDLKRLSIVKHKDQIKGNELAEIYR